MIENPLCKSAQKCPASRACWHLHFQNRKLVWSTLHEANHRQQRADQCAGTVRPLKDFFLKLYHINMYAWIADYLFSYLWGWGRGITRTFRISIGPRTLPTDTEALYSCCGVIYSGTLSYILQRASFQPSWGTPEWGNAKARWPWQFFLRLVFVGGVTWIIKSQDTHIQGWWAICCPFHSPTLWTQLYNVLCSLTMGLGDHKSWGDNA